MGSKANTPHYSHQQYLELEDQNETRSEYHDGEIFAMAGGTEGHSRIAGNLIREAGNAIFDRECSVFEGNLKIRIEAANSTVYPDAMIVCDPIQYHQDRKDIITNPTIVFEVLSEGTAGYDRGGKFRKYQQLPSLKEYVLIEQSEAQVDLFRKSDSGLWTLHSWAGLEGAVECRSLAIRLPLNGIYHRVPFQ